MINDVRNKRELANLDMQGIGLGMMRPGVDYVDFLKERSRISGMTMKKGEMEPGTPPMSLREWTRWCDSVSCILISILEVI